MLDILGAGLAYPNTALDEETLMAIDAGYTVAATGSVSAISRRTSLGLDYLKNTGNSDVRRAQQYALELPTDLAFRAAAMALDAAGLTVDRLGLVIGDSSTPIQTIPTEAQRLVNRFALKIPAFDLMSSTASLALHLQTLQDYKDDKFPEYVLCFSSNTPTHRINYRAGIERTYFGDAAGAIVVSNRHRGRLTVNEAYYETDPAPSLISVDRYGYLNMAGSDLQASIKTRARRLLARVRDRHKPAQGSCVLVANQLFHAALSDVVVESGLGFKRKVQNVDYVGDSLGAGSFCALAQEWDNFRKGDKILVLMAGADRGLGYILLEMNG